ncbi:MAG TPA: hypothetical protein PKA00_04340 [Saprospiraceae bacterium]|nr:hypothetical protein [Saprospiraceae bacterium]HMQ82108.1 hypothetical protein [Saprospiraceae bacterium]
MIGLALGIILPVAGFFLISTLYNQLGNNGLLSSEGFSSNFRERTSAVIAISLNMIPLNVFQKRRFTQSMRGIVIATVGLVVLWLIYFGSDLL